MRYLIPLMLAGCLDLDRACVDVQAWLDANEDTRHDVQSCWNLTDDTVTAQAVTWEPGRGGVYTLRSRVVFCEVDAAGVVGCD